MEQSEIINCTIKRVYEIFVNDTFYSTWYENYKDSFEKFETFFKDYPSKQEESKLNELLKKLILEKDNGIANVGRSTLGEEDFEKLIKDKRFIDAILNFKKNVNDENYKEFDKNYKELGESWKEVIGKRNPARVNRIATALSHDVSTAVVEDIFEQVYDWLREIGFIDKQNNEETLDWFKKNEVVMDKLRKVFQNESDENKPDSYKLSQFVWYLSGYVTKFRVQKQVIYYGQPGTGKTYNAKEETRTLFDIWNCRFGQYITDSKYTYESNSNLIQFHPSFNYEDFIEGFRPAVDEKGEMRLKLQNGIFKEFCKKAGRWEIDYYNIHDENAKKEFGELTFKDINEARFKSKLQDNPHWVDIYGLEGKISGETLLSEIIPPYFFIIDEINRADLSKVFGECLYCFEYRGVDGKISTQYANMNNEITGMLNAVDGNGQNGKSDYKFFIPANVYLIGTMNTIDRSVESIDFALRRRFSWKKFNPDMSILRSYLSRNNQNWEELADRLEFLNDEISKHPLLGPEYQIGHSYCMVYNEKTKFLNLKQIVDEIWYNNIEPLLTEYLRGYPGQGAALEVFRKIFFNKA